MEKAHKHIGLFVAIIVIVFSISFFNNYIGTCKSNIEKDARISQKISDDWQVAKQTTETMSAMIFYDENLSDYTFSIYVKPKGLSLGYFFKYGGSTGSIMESIAEVHMNGYNERAYISMNKQQLSKVEIGNGKNTEIIKIDSRKPFALILSVNIGVATFYDINNNVVNPIPI
ncbi:hypothetical protein HMJ28_03525 [Clostridium cochlearium]|uniref:Uncharacterized protein n=2 Tax=Clostridium cochlearium TaxID=1494 RepID=A0A7Y3V684_CLOCO|nr:hypothetical protein [Clostridium cochlearium]